MFVTSAHQPDCTRPPCVMQENLTSHPYCPHTGYMFDQLLGLLLLGLGIQSPMQQQGYVKGESVEVIIAEDGTSSSPSGEKLTIKERTERAKKQATERAVKTNAAIEKNREAFKGAVEARREKAKELHESKREAFKEKVAAIRDEKKKAIVEAMDTRMAEVNAKRVENMTAHLAKMSEVLEKIVTRAGVAKGEGKDTTAVDAAVTAAQAAITAAQNAVQNQAAKEYVITITDETALKNNVGTTRSGMQQELRVTHETVVAARKAVSGAVQALARVLGVEKVATPAGGTP